VSVEHKQLDGLQAADSRQPFYMVHSACFAGVELPSLYPVPYIQPHPTPPKRRHHGLSATSPSGLQEYYQGSAAYGPIMGSGHSSPRLKQWCAGEYQFASKPWQDDLLTIASYIPHLSDDAPNSHAAAAAAGSLGTLNLASNATVVAASGVIGSASDVDVFRFEAERGGVLLRAYLDLTRSYAFADPQDKTAEARRTKLDSKVELLNQNGAVIRGWDDTDGVLSGRLVHILPSAVSLSVAGVECCWGCWGGAESV